jgi:glucans biosynthesis protein C
MCCNRGEQRDQKDKCSDFITHIPRFTRERALFIFPSFIITLIIICNVIPSGIGNLITSILLFIWFGNVSFSFYKRNISEEESLQSGVIETETEYKQVPLTSFQPIVPPRLYYLDALKACLTILVVIHHTIGAFAGQGSLGLSVGNYRNAIQPFLSSFQIIQQSYFMSLFFFISAYFSPPTVIRKGVLLFIKDRFTRLGIPFLPFLLVLGPISQISAQSIIFNTFLGYNPYSGPLWFVVWLSIFHFGYATVAEAGGIDRYIILDIPSVAMIVFTGALLGFLQGLQLLFFPAFPLMPIVWGSLPFDILFYIGGIIARRNKWLETPLPSFLVVCAKIYSAFFIAGTFAFFYWLYTVGGGVQLLSTTYCDAQTPSRGDLTTGESLLATFAILLGFSIFSGIFTFSMSISLLDLFRQFCNNTSSSFVKFFSDNAYTAYIIHPLLVFPLTAGFVVFIRKSTGLPVDLWANRTDSYSCLSVNGSNEEGALLAGVGVVTLLSLLGTYALAPLFRSIPGAKQVLG